MNALSKTDQTFQLKILNFYFLIILCILHGHVLKWVVPNIILFILVQCSSIVCIVSLAPFIKYQPNLQQMKQGNSPIMFNLFQKHGMRFLLISFQGTEFHVLIRSIISILLEIVWLTCNPLYSVYTSASITWDKRNTDRNTPSNILNIFSISIYRRKNFQ